MNQDYPLCAAYRFGAQDTIPARAALSAAGSILWYCYRQGVASVVGNLCHDCRVAFFEWPPNVERRNELQRPMGEA